MGLPGGEAPGQDRQPIVIPRYTEPRIGSDQFRLIGLTLFQRRASEKAVLPLKL